MNPWLNPFFYINYYLEKNLILNRKKKKTLIVKYCRRNTKCLLRSGIENRESSREWRRKRRADAELNGDKRAERVIIVGGRWKKKMPRKC